MGYVYLKYDISHITTNDPTLGGHEFTIQTQEVLGKLWDLYVPVGAAWTNWSGYNWINYHTPTHWLSVNVSNNSYSQIVFVLNVNITEYSFEDSVYEPNHTASDVNFSYRDYYGKLMEFSYKDYVWVRENYYSPIFDEKENKVDFNNLDSEKWNSNEFYLNGNPDSIYTALGSADIIDLPNMTSDGSAPMMSSTYRWEYSKTFNAGDGNDVIRGGTGNDRIDGGKDSDNISGGAGADVAMGIGSDNGQYGANIIDLGNGFERDAVIYSSNVDTYQTFYFDPRAIDGIKAVVGNSFGDSDTITGWEDLMFSDRTITIEEVLNGGFIKTALLSLSSAVIDLKEHLPDLSGYEKTKRVAEWLDYFDKVTTVLARTATGSDAMSAGRSAYVGIVSIGMTR